MKAVHFSREAAMLIKQDPSIITGYLEDASGFTEGRAERLVIPETEQEVADYLAEASSRQEPVTVAGGRTGVAAGSIPVGGTLLSLEKLERFDPIEVMPAGSTVVVGPAVRLERLKATVAEQGLIYGPDPTERTGSIGGNVATNASGGQSFKYGTTRAHVLGLGGALTTGERFYWERGRFATTGDWLHYPLSSGRILEVKRPQLPGLGVSKNAAGYFSVPRMDPLDLLIGSDGTLAVITLIKLKLLPAPQGVFSLAAFFPTLDAALATAAQVRASADGRKPLSGIAPASLEFMDRPSLDLLRPQFSNLPPQAQACLLIEQETPTLEDPSALEAWANFLRDQGVDEKDIWFADGPEREHLREFRHALPEAVNRIVRERHFRKVGTDMAVPEASFPAMMKLYVERLQASGLDHLIFGHIGECHLHANVLPRTAQEFEQARQLYLEFARQAVALGGTVSAEHGIGKIKHDFLAVMVGEQGFQEMARVKRTFDPALILNRGNVFPERYLAEG